MPHLQVVNITGMEHFNQLCCNDLSPFSSLFFGKTKYLTGIKIFLIKISLSALLTFIREQNVLMSFLLPNNFFMSSEITGKLLVGRLFIKVTEFPIFELTVSPVFDCNESNSENVTFKLCKLEAALLDAETEENRLRGVNIESCESGCFAIIL